jgi:hypothetical protein
MGAHKHIGDTPLVLVATGEADIDVSAADYTAWQALLTIAPQAGLPIKMVMVSLDLDKATTGYATLYTTETIQFAVARKTDGTNWRRDEETVTTAVAGDAADGFSVDVPIGPVGENEQARIEVKLSAENANDVEFPYAVYYDGSEPTITAVAAA